MTEIEGGFTAFSHRSARAASGKKRYLEDNPERPVDGSFSLDRDQLRDMPVQDRRWAWVEVNLKAISANCNSLRQRVGYGRHVMAVVSADAYGHGAVRVAQTVLRAGADTLAVATVDEAIQLRDAGIDAPILLLSQPPETAIPLLVGFDIMPSIQTAEFAIGYGEVADRCGKKAPFHLYINVGLNTGGVHYTEAAALLQQTLFHRALELKGTYTEFSPRSTTELVEMQRQAQRFFEVVSTIRASVCEPGLVHCANTSSSLLYTDLHCDMVRVGLSLYGLHPSRETVGLIDLRPAMSVHARMTNVMTVPIGESVGYGQAYRSGGSAKICTIPVGYADGYPQALSGRTQAIYQGQTVRQVGAIAMDSMTLEVEMRTRPGLPRLNPQVGDQVVLVGYEGQAIITLDELASQCGMTNYELACRLGQRLPKIYG